MEELRGDVAAEHVFGLIAGEAVDEVEAFAEDAESGVLGERGVRGGDGKNEEAVFPAKVLEPGGRFDADGLDVRPGKHEAVDFVVGAVDGW